ncbi:YfjI family protein [Priestia megaterium]|uniref:YfjI family protein n=1 Tax=Priestia megaterium TaxID=1404 RepID=UPI002877B545|nr:YfjI family protein [Priestia megaterium]
MNKSEQLLKLISKQDLVDTGIYPNEKVSPGDIDWDIPVQFDEYSLPSFPTGIMPNWLDSYVNAVAETTQTPLDAPACITLAILSTVLAKKTNVRAYGDWVEPVNLYTIVVLPPANRKSAVFDLMKFPLVKHEQNEQKRMIETMNGIKAKRSALNKRKEKLEHDYAKSGEEEIIKEITSLEEELNAIEKITVPRFIVDDITQERLIGIMVENEERIAILSAEGGIFEIIGGRYSNGKSNVEIFLKGHSGDYCAVDRMGRTEALNNPALTIGLFVQPSVIKSLPNSFKEVGLLGRILYSIPPSRVGYRNIRPEPIEKNLKELYEINILKLLRLPTGKPIELSFTEEADKLLQHLQQYVEDKLKPGAELEDIQEWGGKLLGQIVRIAGLFHIAKEIEIKSDTETIKINDLDQKIKKETLEQAAQLLPYLIAHAKATFGCMKLNKGLEDAKYLLNVIKNKNKQTIAYRDIQQLTKKRFDTSDLLRAALNVLTEKGFIRERKEGKKAFYDINPYFLKSAEATPSAPKTLNTTKGIEKQSVSSENSMSPFPPLERSNGGNGEIKESILNTNEYNDLKSSNTLGVVGEKIVIDEEGIIEL